MSTKRVNRFGLLKDMKNFTIRFKYGVKANDKNKDKITEYQIKKLTPDEKKYKNNQRWRSKNTEKVKTYNNSYYTKSKKDKVKCKCGKMVCPRNMKRHETSQYHIFSTQYVFKDDE